MKTKLESNTGKLKIEIAVLQEQKTSLEACLSDVSNRAADDSRLQRLAHANAISEYENKISQQEITNARILQAEERRATRAEKELDDLKNEINELKRDLRLAKKAGTDLGEKLVNVQVELEATKTRALEDVQPSPAQVEENDQLKERIKELECVNGGLVERAKRIAARHKEGDLVCVFVFLFGHTTDS
jgi:chromosome segregation ATPase